ncbi:hypothetical protein FHX49_000756 [Microbacterium endophyticum]|uniref:HNH nuclease domain-containing protein n=1 Tax=Microbacterium endophyticum TaxID=1526412 RepID=A0A7W4V2N1_9MICO|nr:HNH endonuclease signature motif containing protein [Microbacterium endophyticum]MBB2975215.1 hypothetical protein [Microbacterium endophyticum]NIK37573.1 hypothetical protein [Microbacterium endophyticum]
MNILTAIRERLDRLAARAELDVEPRALPATTNGLTDAAVLEVLRDLAGMSNDVGRLQSVLAGVAAQRSRREDGHSGLAATEGHSSPTALVQSIMGGTRAEAQRQVRIGTSLVDAEDRLPADEADRRRPLWHEPLRRALLDGRITAAQHDAVRSGLGEPIVGGVDDETAAAAWSVAADQLADEATSLTAEDLAARARGVRDILDPTGAEARCEQRYEKRSLRMWIDQHGQHHGHLTFDDEMAHWVRALTAAALRPRLGGPRFVADGEREAAATLTEDPRSNEQLEYDLFMDVLRAGSLAEASDVFGARQPGVRMIVVKDLVGPRDALGRLLAVGHTEDGGAPIPGSIIDRSLCTSGALDVTVDSCGNPLDVGREQRLFTPKQRIALAARDGGCVWPGCQRHASYCEAHHIDHFSADHGRTDIDRGVLLCRFHHMFLHNRGWKIERNGLAPFVLRPPGDARGHGNAQAMELRSKAPWNWAWDPPRAPHRERWRQNADREPMAPRLTPQLTL